ncbi:MAG: fructose-bisphosphate aldolase [Chloroflexi bacterium]|nr:fructose-bisphosphate aldolase [Chloroflexota bacterium]
MVRTRLEEMNLPVGKLARLRRLFYEHGPGNGTAMFLPVDHGLEHGPGDFVSCPESADPEFELKLALEAGYSGVVFHVGISQRYRHDFAGKVPLVLKLNGKTNVPPDDEAFSPLIAHVETAVRLGADAVGYTLYVGSPAQDRDFVQFMGVREEAERLGMPVIVWAYPRGRAIEEKGGRDTLYAIDYAARVAMELGADVIKVNMPEIPVSGDEAVPEPYHSLHLDLQQAVEKIVQSAGRCLVLFSGGSRLSDADMLARMETAMKAGAAGTIFGRNSWQRPYPEALRLAAQMKEIIGKYGDA